MHIFIGASASLVLPDIDIFRRVKPIACIVVSVYVACQSVFVSNERGESHIIALLSGVHSTYSEKRATLNSSATWSNHQSFGTSTAKQCKYNSVADWEKHGCSVKIMLRDRLFSMLDLRNSDDWTAVLNKPVRVVRFEHLFKVDDQFFFGCYNDQFHASGMHACSYMERCTCAFHGV